MWIGSCKPFICPHLLLIGFSQKNTRKSNYANSTVFVSLLLKENQFFVVFSYLLFYEFTDAFSENHYLNCSKDVLDVTEWLIPKRHHLPSFQMEIQNVCILLGPIWSHANQFNMQYWNLISRKTGSKEWQCKIGIPSNVAFLQPFKNIFASCTMSALF